MDGHDDDEEDDEYDEDEDYITEGIIGHHICTSNLIIIVLDFQDQLVEF